MFICIWTVGDFDEAADKADRDAYAVTYYGPFESMEKAASFGRSLLNSEAVQELDLTHGWSVDRLHDPK